MRAPTLRDTARNVVEYGVLQAWHRHEPLCPGCSRTARKLCPVCLRWLCTRHFRNDLHACDQQLIDQQGDLVAREATERALRGTLANTTRDRAQNVAEYGVLIATIAIIVLLGVAKFGSQIEPWFAALAGRITTVGT